MRVEILTWADFDSAIEVLVEKVVSSGRIFSNIYGIPRGGLVVAVALSHRLDLPVIMSVDLVSGSTLVVDDISDGGTTLSAFAGKVGAVATIHIVSGTKVVPDFFVWYRLEKWVHYPWEKV